VLSTTHPQDSRDSNLLRLALGLAQKTELKTENLQKLLNTLIKLPHYGIGNQNAEALIIKVDSGDEEMLQCG